MAIDMLFTKTDDALEGLLPDDSKGDANDRDSVLPKHSTVFKSFRNEYEKSTPIIHLSRITVEIFFFLAVFTLFAFTFAVVLTNDISNDLIKTSDDFYFYISLKLSIKLVMII